MATRTTNVVPQRKLLKLAEVKELTRLSRSTILQVEVAGACSRRPSRWAPARCAGIWMKCCTTSTRARGAARGTSAIADQPRLVCRDSCATAPADRSDGGAPARAVSCWTQGGACSRRLGRLAAVRAPVAQTVAREDGRLRVSGVHLVAEATRERAASTTARQWSRTLRVAVRVGFIVTLALVVHAAVVALRAVLSWRAARSASTRAHRVGLCPLADGLREAARLQRVTRTSGNSASSSASSKAQCHRPVGSYVTERTGDSIHAISALKPAGSVPRFRRKREGEEQGMTTQSADGSGNTPRTGGTTCSKPAAVRLECTHNWLGWLMAPRPRRGGGTARERGLGDGLPPRGGAG